MTLTVLIVDGKDAGSVSDHLGKHFSCEVTCSTRENALEQINTGEYKVLMLDTSVMGYEEHTSAEEDYTETLISSAKENGMAVFATSLKLLYGRVNGYDY